VEKRPECYGGRGLTTADTRKTPDYRKGENKTVRM